MAANKRDQLVDAALRLFDRDGFHATGIDRILAESGVAKMTLYNHFRSKDELILAALRRRDEHLRNWFMRNVEQRARTPRDRLLALFDALADWLGGRGANRCLFISASAEFCGKSERIRAGCADHKQMMADYVRGLANAAGARDPAALADALILLMEGAIVMAQVMGNPASVSRARKAAETLIDDAVPA